MTEAEWLACDDSVRMLDPVRIPDVVGSAPSGRRFRLFAVACGRLWGGNLSDGRLYTALDVAELFADGVVPLTDLHATHAVVRGVSLSYRSCHIVEAAVLPELCDVAAYVTARCLGSGGYVRTSSRKAAALLRDVFGNPFRPVAFAPEWRTDTAVALARTMYESRDFGAMPILADALQDAGCDSDEILTHCRDPKHTHVRGCWVTDLVLGKA